MYLRYEDSKLNKYVSEADPHGNNEWGPLLIGINVQDTQNDVIGHISVTNTSKHRAVQIPKNLLTWKSSGGETTAAFMGAGDTLRPGQGKSGYFSLKRVGHDGAMYMNDEGRSVPFGSFD